MDKNFRVVVHIIRGTCAGRALSLMASGMQCVAETKDDACKILADYIDAAHAILEHIPNDICFGVCVIVDTSNGHIECVQSLQGLAK